MARHFTLRDMPPRKVAQLLCHCLSFRLEQPLGPCPNSIEAVFRRLLKTSLFARQQRAERIKEAGAHRLCTIQIHIDIDIETLLHFGRKLLATAVELSFIGETDSVGTVHDLFQADARTRQLHAMTRNGFIIDQPLVHIPSVHQARETMHPRQSQTAPYTTDTRLDVVVPYQLTALRHQSNLCRTIYARHDSEARAALAR